MYNIDYRISLKYKLLHIKYLSVIFKGFNYLLEYGFLKTIDKILKKLLLLQSLNMNYVLYQSIKEKHLQEKQFTSDDSIIDFIVIIDNLNKNILKKLIMSFKKQTVKKWKLHIIDIGLYKSKYINENVLKNININYYEFSNNESISEILNTIIDSIQNNYIGFLDQYCFLHSSAIYVILNHFKNENADFLYSDEVFYKNNKIIKRVYKTEFSFISLRAFNYITNICVFKKSLLKLIWSLPKYKYYNDWYYDLIFKLTENAGIIRKIAKLLCFKNIIGKNNSCYLLNNNKVLIDHLLRANLNSHVQETSIPLIKKINYSIIDNPLISILIPTMDHVDDLSKCILSILNKSTYSNYEIILIENNSKNENTFKYYKSLMKYENIKVIFWEYNYFNYSAINNYGFKYANGEYIIFLNNDIEIIAPNWIQEMLMFAQNDSTGIVGAKLYYSDKTIQHAGIYFNREYLPVHNHKYFHKNKTGSYYELVIPRYVSAVTGACLMISSNIFKEVNGFDEQFEIDFNDIDLCMKIKESGYSIIWTPYAEAYHYESKSRGYSDTDNNKYNRYNYESNAFMKKWKSKIINNNLQVVI